MSATLWAVVPWRPRLRGRRSHLPVLVRLGAAYSGVDVLAAVSANVDYLFVGRVLGPAALGLYSIAFRLPDLLVMNLSLVAGRVLFPAFAAVARDALGGAYLLAFRYTMLFAIPLAAGWPRSPSRSSSPSSVTAGRARWTRCASCRSTRSSSRSTSPVA